MTGRRVLAAALVVLWLAALVLVVKSGVDRFSAAPWGNAMGGGLSPEVAGSTQVGQAWTAPLPGLYRIEVWLQPPATGTSQPLLFHLRDGPDAGDDLRTATIDPAQISAGTPYAIEFEPLRDSKAATFYFYLESPQARPGKVVRAVYGSGSVLEGAGAYVDGRPVEGNLVFQTHYSLRTRDKAGLLLERLAEGRPYFLGSESFYVGLAVVYGLLLLLLIWAVARKVTSRQE